MSDDTLDQLAASAADVLVRAMASDAWDQAKHQFGRIIQGRERAVARFRDAVTAQPGADEAAVARETTAWEARLRDVLDHDPSMAEDLRRVCAQAASAPVTQTQTFVQRGTQGSAQQASATGAGASAINAQGRNVRVNSPDQRQLKIAAPIVPLIDLVKRFGVGKSISAVAVLAIAGGGTYVAVHGGGSSPQQAASNTSVSVVLHSGQSIDLDAGDPVAVSGTQSTSGFVSWGDGDTFEPNVTSNFVQFAPWTGSSLPASVADCESTVAANEGQKASSTVVGSVNCYITPAGEVGYLQVLSNDAIAETISVQVVQLGKGEQQRL